MFRTSKQQLKELYSYRIAGERDAHTSPRRRAIYAHYDSEAGLHIWGEIVGEGRSTVADLSQILVEVAAVCDAAPSQDRARQQAEHFGTNLGEVLAEWMTEQLPDEKPAERAVAAIEGILNSMETSYSRHVTVRENTDEWQYILEYPLRETAVEKDLQEEVALSHRALNAFCHALVASLAPNLDLLLPDVPSTDKTSWVLTVPR